MNGAHEFYYRMPFRAGGQRPGSHPSASRGPGQEFISHVSLFERPDPRRLDLRASLRDIRDDWLVRVSRQRVSIPVNAVVDTSASMYFGVQKPKLHLAAEFVEMLGRSTHRAGDVFGMVAFDSTERTDLFVPAQLSRGTGELMSQLLRRSRATQSNSSAANNISGLTHAVVRVAGRPGLMFLISDFHFPLEQLRKVLDSLSHVFVVPIVVWDNAEVEPPAKNAIAALRDAESGARRTLLLRSKLRQQWRAAVAKRRVDLDQFFAAWSMRPFYVIGSFDCDAMSRYFLETLA